MASQQAEAAIRALASATGNTSEGALIASHLSDILDILPHPRKWALRSLDALVFCKLLQYSASVEVMQLDRCVHVKWEIKVLILVKIDLTF